MIDPKITAQKVLTANNVHEAWKSFESYAKTLSFRDRKRFLLNCTKKVPQEHRWYGYYLAAYVALEQRNWVLVIQFAHDAISYGAPETYFQDIMQLKEIGESRRNKSDVQRE